MPPQSSLNNSQDSEGEISLIDILRFLKGAHKTILLFGVVGLAIAIVYLAITPKQYEAIAKITMAQIGTASNNNFNPLGVNIEEPSLLVARMAQPTSFTPHVISSCGMEGQTNSGMLLAKSIKLSPTKGVANIVELRTFGKSPEAALSCAQAIFDLIQATQAKIVAPYIEEAQIKLKDDEERLAKAKDLIAKADKSGSPMGAAYLSTRDEIRFLLDEITALKNVVTSSQNRATRLIAPIFASKNPATPQKLIALVSGIFGGLFLGLLLALGLRVWTKLKGQLQDIRRGVG